MATRVRSTFISEMRDQGRAEGRVEGRAEGWAESILATLQAREIDVPAEVAERIRGCGDIDVLRGWLKRAVTVSSAEEIFAEK